SAAWPPQSFAGVNDGAVDDLDLRAALFFDILEHRTLRARREFRVQADDRGPSFLEVEPNILRAGDGNDLAQDAAAELPHLGGFEQLIGRDAGDRRGGQGDAVQGELGPDFLNDLMACDDFDAGGIEQA